MSLVAGTFVRIMLSLNFQWGVLDGTALKAYSHSCMSDFSQGNRFWFRTRFGVLQWMISGFSVVIWRFGLWYWALILPIKMDLSPASPFLTASVTLCRIFAQQNSCKFSEVWFLPGDVRTPNPRRLQHLNAKPLKPHPEALKPYK